jgi:hypothetical protein
MSDNSSHGFVADAWARQGDVQRPHDCAGCLLLKNFERRTHAPDQSARKFSKKPGLRIGRQDAGMVHIKSALQIAVQLTNQDTQVANQLSVSASFQHQLTVLANTHLRRRSPSRLHDANLRRSGASLYELVHTGPVFLVVRGLDDEFEGRTSRLVDQVSADRNRVARLRVSHPGMILERCLIT